LLTINILENIIMFKFKKYFLNFNKYLVQKRFLKNLIELKLVEIYLIKIFFQIIKLKIE